MSGPSEGDPAPAFDLPADGGGRLSSAALAGKPYVIYFYPKDDTPGCTKEACGFRDNLAALGKADAVVIGVSRDSVASHDKFKKKFELPFPLAADVDGKVCEAYGAWVEKSMYGKKYMGIDRSTFVIGPDVKVKAIFRKVKVEGHVDEVQAAVAAG